MVDLKTIRQLIKLMQDNDLAELDLQDKAGEKIRLRRGNDTPGSFNSAPAPGTPGNFNSAPASGIPGSFAGGGFGQGAGVGGPAVSTAGGPDLGLVEIKSPMVGTFYSAPSPDASPFVGPGAKVGDETVVCIVEAMKVFNEIKAETRGTIEKVLVESGQAVEFGQPLFLVKP